MECAEWQFRAAVRATSSYPLESALTNCDIGLTVVSDLFQEELLSNKHAD